MKKKTLNSVEARRLLESVAKKTAEEKTWLTHALCVGECAGKIAAAMGLDTDHAKTLGYLHDIGRGLGAPREHIVNGYHYLKEAGYDDEYCNICLVHSFLNNNCEFLSGDEIDNQSVVDFINQHQYTVYEEIVILSDLMCECKPMTIEERVMGILLRYGTSKNTQRHLRDIFDLKTKIEQKLGRNIYDVVAANLA